MAIRNVCWTAIAVMATGTGVAQKYVPPPPPLTVEPCMAVANPLLPKDPSAKEVPVCAPAPAKVPEGGALPPSGKTAADEFPFPGEQVPAARPATKPAQTKQSPAEQFPYPGSAPVLAPPAAGKAADQFPYPGETSKSPDAMPEGDAQRYVPEAPASGEKAPAGAESGSSSSSSSSSGSSSSSTSTSGGIGDMTPAPGSDATADDGSHGRSHGRRALPKVSAVSPDEREAEDLEVAKFYSDRGNFQAAYLRAKDATRLVPEDAQSHFALAQAAERLQRKDEAMAEYAQYLKLDPAGEKTVAAQRALSQLK